MNSRVVLLVVACALLLLAGCDLPGKPTPADIVRRPSDNLDPVALYKQNCAGCHGADGKGSTVGSNLVNGPRIWSDGTLASITNVIRTGVAKPKSHTGLMPPMGGATLSDAGLAAVASYVWAIGYQARK